MLLIFPVPGLSVPDPSSGTTATERDLYRALSGVIQGGVFISSHML